MVQRRYRNAVKKRQGNFSKSTERSLQQAEEKYRNFFEYSVDGIFQSTPAGRFIIVNPALARMWGYESPEDLISSINQIAQQVYVNPEERVKFLHLMNQDDSVHGFEFQVYRKDGSILWVQESVRTVRDENGEVLYYEGTVRDISEVKQSEEFLRRSEERYRRTLNNMLEGCQIIDYDWRYIYVNDTAAQQGRRKPEEMLMRTMPDLYPGIENTEMFNALRRCMENRTPHRMENQFRFPDGDTGWFELSIEPVPEGLFILSIDITERKRAEKKIKQQLDRLTALSEIDRVIASSFDLNLSLNQLIRQVILQLNVDAAAILLTDPATNTLEVIAGEGFIKQTPKNLQVRVAQDYAGKVLQERRMIHVHDLTTAHPPFNREYMMKGENFVTYFGLPLIAKGELKGVLEVFQRRQTNPDEEWLSYLATLAGQAAIAIDNVQLFNSLQQSNAELRLAYDATIEGWSYALDLRDKETEGHTRRVTEMTCKLGKKFGSSADEMTYTRWGSLLHDIGKMGVPDAILQKPDKLTEKEWDIMKMHPVFARNMLERISYLKSAIDIPYCHHEHWDGSGYPRGLKKEEIPMSARLFGVADVWDALTSDRPYRRAWPKEKALEYIKSGTGKQFDPQVVQLFLESEELWNGSGK